MDSPQSERASWFAAEVLPHEPLLRTWLAARFPDLTDRDDLVQEAFLRVLRLPETTGIENPKAFLFATARNLALNLLRHQRHERPNCLGEIDASAVLDERTDTPEWVARRQEMDLLTEALDALPERCRQVFILRRIHGLSQKQIAERLGISEKTVENQGVLALRKCVEFFRQRQRMPLRRALPAPPSIRDAALTHPEARHA